MKSPIFQKLSFINLADKLRRELSSIAQPLFKRFPILRTISRRTLKLCWWIVTLQLSKKLAERKTLQKPNQVPSQHKIHMVYISKEIDTPGHLYRVVRYAEAAQAAGLEVQIIPIDKVLLQLSDIKKADLIVIWRTNWSDILSQVFDIARSLNKKIIFDVDDLMMEPDLAKNEIIDGIRSQGFDETAVAAFYETIRITFFLADLCTAPTQFLVKRMRSHCKPALVLPNGFDANTVMTSRLAVRKRQKAGNDNLIRIGYAAGSLTHQKDFSLAVKSITRLLRKYPKCRLVLFRAGETDIVNLSEYPELQDLLHQIEWRDMVTLEKLPEEMARFDINIAPLEPDNVFCNAKSELKYFEAALVEVPTIASPTEPYREAIQDGITGFLARTSDEWYEKLKTLIDNKELRQRIGRNAFHDVLWTYGPERRIELIKLLVDQEYHGGQRAAHAFELLITKQARNRYPLPVIPPHEILIEIDTLKPSQVTIIVPVYNYAHYLEEALESVKKQILANIDLVIVDDVSSDNSVEVAKKWIANNRLRFNRIILAKNQKNSGLSLTRNVGFSLADTPFILPLDPDNKLLPECTKECLAAITENHAAFAYPIIERFGSDQTLIGNTNYKPVYFAGGNYIDAMALIRKACWAAVGGYHEMHLGHEDYDLWCKFVEVGFFGVQVPQILALYRVHPGSMLHTTTNINNNLKKIQEDMQRRHAWLTY